MADVVNPQSDSSMLPEPSDEQVKLWDDIEESLNQENIDTIAIFQNLPEKIKEHASSHGTAIALKNICEKYQIIKEAKLPYIIYLVVLGKINIVNFVKTLQEKCRLDEVSARQLARQINKEIFLPIKEELKTIHKVPNWPREEDKPAQIASEPPTNVVNLKQ